MDQNRIAAKIAGISLTEQERVIAERFFEQALELVHVAGAEGYQDLFPKEDFEEQRDDGASPAMERVTSIVEAVISKLRVIANI
jgi:hypothetical protein